MIIHGELKCERTGEVRFRAVQRGEETRHAVTIDVIDLQHEDEEVAAFFVKWDGCAHVGLKAPDMDWVHVCGAGEMQAHLDMLAWAWNLSVDLLKAKGFTEADLAHVIAGAPKPNGITYVPIPLELLNLALKYLGEGADHTAGLAEEMPVSRARLDTVNAATAMRLVADKLRAHREAT